MPEVNIAQLQAEVAAAGFDVPLTEVGGEVFAVGADGSLGPPPAGVAAVVAAHVPAPPPPTKGEILRSMLETVDPADPDIEILWLVQMESLTP